MLTDEEMTVLFEKPMAEVAALIRQMVAVDSSPAAISHMMEVLIMTLCKAVQQTKHFSSFASMLAVAAGTLTGAQDDPKTRAALMTAFEVAMDRAHVKRTQILAKRSMQ